TPRRPPLPTRPARRHNLLQHNRRHTALRSLNAPSDHSTAPAASASTPTLPVPRLALISRGRRW
ncbi:hypothetical protein AB0N26_32795, partial [Streptomyces cellulosae]